LHSTNQVIPINVWGVLRFTYKVVEFFLEISK
jgi:hypothetical protein